MVGKSSATALWILVKQSISTEPCLVTCRENYFCYLWTTFKLINFRLFMLVVHPRKMCLTKAVSLMRVLWRSSFCDTSGSWWVGEIQGKDGWHCWGCSWQPSGTPEVGLVSLKHRICLQDSVKSKSQVFWWAQIIGFRMFRFQGPECVVCFCSSLVNFGTECKKNLVNRVLGWFWILNAGFPPF